MIRDQLVIGIRDESSSEWLQMESDLKAKKFARQREAIQQQQGILKGTKDTQKNALEAMYVNRNRTPVKVQNRAPITNKQAAPTQIKVCRRCGKTSYPRQLCPANNATCLYCNRKGHFSSQCLLKTMGELTISPYQQTDNDILDDDDPYSNAAFLSADAVYVDAVQNTNSPQWNITLTVGAQLVMFKVDTGAEVTALSEKIYNLLHDSVPKLQKSTHKLCEANREPKRSFLIIPSQFHKKCLSFEIYSITFGGYQLLETSRSSPASMQLNSAFLTSTQLFLLDVDLKP